MPNTTHCFDLLLGDDPPDALPEVVVAFGEDGFLRRETVSTMLARTGLSSGSARANAPNPCDRTGSGSQRRAIIRTARITGIFPLGWLLYSLSNATLLPFSGVHE